MKAWVSPKEIPRGTAVAVPVRVPQRMFPSAARRNRFEIVDDRPSNVKDDKMYCLMLTLLALCGAGVLICVLVAGIIYASQTGGGSGGD